MMKHKQVSLPGGAWRAMMPSHQRLLLEQAWYLVQREQQLPHSPIVIDYSFLVFTAAKVFEGFLKTYLYQLGLISRAAYFSPHFRIGKALNPDLPMKYRDDYWLFDDLREICGEELSLRLWSTWKLARNSVFHYESGGANQLTFEEAQERVEAVVETIETAAKSDGMRKA
jgi:hypothetical protein